MGDATPETTTSSLPVYTTTDATPETTSDATPEMTTDATPEYTTTDAIQEDLKQGDIDFKKKATEDTFSCWCDSPDGGENCSTPYAICDHVDMDCADYFDDDFNCIGSEMEYACDY